MAWLIHQQQQQQAANAANANSDHNQPPAKRARIATTTSSSMVSADFQVGGLMLSWHAIVCHVTCVAADVCRDVMTRQVVAWCMQATLPSSWNLSIIILEYSYYYFS